MQRALFPDTHCAQHRHLGHGPDRAEGRARRLVAKIDDDRLERDAVLVQGDERLVAEGRKRMEIQIVPLPVEIGAAGAIG